MSRPSAGWLTTAPPGCRGDLVAGITLAAYAIPVSLAYAALAGLPPQVGIYGYLLGGLGYALLGSSRQLAIGPTSAISLMIAGTVGAMAEGDAAALRADRQPRGLHRGGAVPDRLAAAAERARQADQRQHPGRLQGRRGPDHRHDPAAEPVRRAGRRPQFLRAAFLLAGQLGQMHFARARRRRRRDRAACARRAPAARTAGRARRRRAVDRRCVAAGAAGARRADRPEKSRRACRPWQARRCGCATSRESFRWPPAACCSPISKAYRRRAPSRPSTDTRSIRGRSCSASARPISRRRWATAIRSPAACRNRRSTTRPARARRWRWSSPRSRWRCACCS